METSPRIYIKHKVSLYIVFVETYRPSVSLPVRVVNPEI